MSERSERYIRWASTNNSPRIFFARRSLNQRGFPRSKQVSERWLQPATLPLLTQFIWLGSFRSSHNLFFRSTQLARYFKSHEEEARGINYRVAGSSANETDETPPLIITNSEHASAAKLCTSATARKSIARWVPRNLRGRELDLVFTTNVHGRALANLYLALEKSRGREFLTLVEVLDGNKGPTTIGMFSDARWQISSSVYGGGGCFVFKLSPQPKCFVWGGGGGEGGGGGGGEKMSEKDEAALELFMMSNNEYISMGGNVEGGAALRINEDLTKGFSDKTTMFGNPELVEGGEFEIGTVEVFAFKRMY